MTKSDLAAAVAQSSPQLSRRQAETVVNTVFGAMADALKAGDRIEIRGFGSFQVRDREPRVGRNPRTGQVVRIDARRVPFFKVGKELKARVDGSDAG